MRRHLVFAAILFASTVFSAWPAAQARRDPAPGPFPRTPDGRPDLQGIWSNSTQTPLQRPVELGLKAVYTDTEIAKLRQRDHDAPPRDGDPGTYNQFWWDEGDFLKQTSLIVDPPDGRIPFSAEGLRRRSEQAREAGNRTDNPEDRNLAERCISRSAPKLPGGYNNNFQIVQTRDYVMVVQEMIHEARIIPLDGRPHAPAHVRSYLGDARGRWEGDTLVVETANYNSHVDEASFGCCGGGAEHMSIVERFRMIDADTLEHEYTVTDPTMFTRAWTVRMPMGRVPGPIYEYACHEGNHAMAGILRGARQQERERAKRP